MAKKGLLTKKVAFQGTQVTMYSIDGVTWSTRPEELEAIIQRHLLQQAGVSADLKGEEKVPVPKAKPKKFNRVHDDSELDEVIEEDSVEESFDDVEDDVGEDEVLPTQSKSKKTVEAPAKAPKAAKPQKKQTAALKAKVTQKKPKAKAPQKKPVKKAPAKPAKKAKKKK